ncbi:MAG: NAD-dependent epimerase/dehydratase family protein [Parachlamydiaceae bacterium]|nr:NAD-dependent epimerase/dehydratase family protein [Parachlamydiaceae bacterium]
MTKKVFITGAAGFIGFHLARFLRVRGDDVIGYDNFNDYYDPKLKRDRANKLAKIDIQVLEGDICDQSAIQKAVKEHQTTHIVHLAAQAGVRYSLDNPHAYIKSNIEGFLNILEICRRDNNIQLIYASSSSVYGRNEKIPFSTSDQTDKQASLYGITKKTNEMMAETYHHLFGVKSTGLRFFTVYGPWGRPDMAYFLFTKAILENRPIDIFNQGEMSRDFTYIDDIVQGIVSAIDRAYECDIFNLGHHHPNTLLELVETIENELGIKAKKNWLPMQPGDVMVTYADIEDSTNRLDFLPKVSLAKGISNFIQWYKEYYDLK